MNTEQLNKLRHTVVFSSIVIFVLVLITSFAAITLMRAAEEQSRIHSIEQK